MKQITSFSTKSKIKGKEDLFAFLHLIGRLNQGYIVSWRVLPVPLICTYLMPFGNSIGWSSGAGSASLGSAQNKQTVILPYVQALSQFRDNVKHLAISNKTQLVCQELLKLSDNVRDDQLLQLGVNLEDRDSSIGEPALIKFGDPAELIAAREAKLQAQLEKEQKKEAARLEALRVEKDKAEKAKVNPQDMFRTEEYSEWDGDGIPTKDAQGEEVTKSKRKTLKKAWDKQKRLYDAQVAAGSGA